MEPEEIKPSGIKIFLRILLGAFVVFLILAITAFILTERKNAREAQQLEVLTVVPEERIYTDEEKLQILTSLVAQTPQDTVTQSEKKRVLQLLSEQATIPEPSNEEKSRILNAMQ